MPNFQFSRRANWQWQDKILGAPQRGQKIIVNQSKPILVVISIKPFTCQSLRQNYFSREIEWAVFTETASILIACQCPGRSSLNFLDPPLLNYGTDEDEHLAQRIRNAKTTGSRCRDQVKSCKTIDKIWKILDPEFVDSRKLKSQACSIFFLSDDFAFCAMQTLNISNILALGKKGSVVSKLKTMFWTVLVLFVLIVTENGLSADFRATIKGEWVEND